MIRSTLTLMVLGFTFAAGAVNGPCGGRPLPSNKIRKLSDLRLECAVSVDNYMRRPQPFDFNAWRELEEQGKRTEMQRLRREQQPDIKWSGRIPYETVERWTWVDWVYGQDPSCGYDTHQVCTKDSKGNETCTEYKTMRSCWHDETRYEARHCSTEVISFNAEFVRPSLQEWNISSAGYYDVIPNKYDLLPGEIENVQVFSNSGESTTIVPAAKIANAWNEYNTQDIRIHETGSRAAQCRFQQPLNMTVKLRTVKRLTNKTSPNAFAANPLDEDGRPMKPLRFLSGGKPNLVRLADTSQNMIEAMARQSRNFSAEIEAAKVKAGKDANVSNDEAKKQMKVQGFWADTRVRVRLIEITGFLQRNDNPTQSIYVTGADTSILGRYEIDLESANPRKDLFRSSGPFQKSLRFIYDWFRLELKPNQKYEVRVSMYQKGVPFYAQDCEERPSFGCSLFRSENTYYSKELPVPFTTGDKDYRPTWQRIYDYRKKNLVEKLGF